MSASVTRDAGGDHFARLGVAADDHPRDRRGQHEVGRELLGGVEGGLGGGDLRARRGDPFRPGAFAQGAQRLGGRVAARGGDPHSGLCDIDRLLAHGAAPPQRREAVQLALGALRLGLGGAEVRVRLFDLGWARPGQQIAELRLRLGHAGAAGVDVAPDRGLGEPDQRVAIGDRVALAREHPGDARRSQRRDIHLHEFQHAGCRGCHRRFRAACRGDHGAQAAGHEHPVGARPHVVPRLPCVVTPGRAARAE